MSLWKRDTEVITRAEEALSMAVNLFLEKIKEDNELVPSFNTFYEFVQEEFRGILEEKALPREGFRSHQLSECIGSLIIVVEKVRLSAELRRAARPLEQAFCGI